MWVPCSVPPPPDAGFHSLGLYHSVDVLVADARGEVWIGYRQVLGEPHLEGAVEGEDYWVDWKQKGRDGYNIDAPVAWAVLPAPPRPREEA